LAVHHLRFYRFRRDPLTGKSERRKIAAGDQEQAAPLGPAKMVSGRKEWQSEMSP
jgi:hypothetical protein